MRKKAVGDIDVAAKRVLVRVDFNVPLAEDGGIFDDLRMRGALPTIEYLRKEGARLILCSHLGRPKGCTVESLRLAPVAERLAELIDAPVASVRDCAGPEAEAAADQLTDGGVLLLENLRFHAGEEANDPAFARQLALLADVLVNDAFGTAHRAHASNVGVAQHLPAVAGLLMAQEIEYLDCIIREPHHPVAAVIGGAKIGDKMAALRNLVSRIEVLIIGGGMANTFLKAQGRSIGASLVEDGQIDAANAVMAEAKQRKVHLLLPVDVVVADEFSANARARIVPVDSVPDGWRIMDAGNRSIVKYAEALQGCRTVVWNGPLGVMEFPQFARGSESLAQIIAALDATTIAGGGETAALIREADLADGFDHISTGGGAFLEYLEGRELPGIAALLDR